LSVCCKVDIDRYKIKVTDNAEANYLLKITLQQSRKFPFVGFLGLTQLAMPPKSRLVEQKLVIG